MLVDVFITEMDTTYEGYLSKEKAMDAAELIWQNYCYEVVFPEGGFSVGDVYETEVQLRHVDEENDEPLMTTTDSVVCEYQKSDWEEHNTMYKGGSL